MFIFKIIGNGRIKVISISKIKKIIAIRKNLIEKGRRAELLGANPHSKGEGLLRLVISFLNNKELIIIKIVGKIVTKIRANKIISSVLGLTNWKLDILDILKK